MANLIISGETNPEIGKDIFYSIFPVGLDQTIANPLSPISTQPAHWEIYVLEKRKWRKTTQNAKTGDTVSYNFNQKSLVREGIKIVVTRGNDKGELHIKTKRAGKPKVKKVELFDRNYHKISKPLNYTDTIIAKAYCDEMEGETVLFTLWEDDAVGSGHNKINEMNKINPIPLRKDVVDGVAEVRFNMALYTQAARIADMQVAKGDKNEGKNHEYYVTVDYYGKMVGESKNVNIQNPNYDNPIQRALELQYPEKFPPKPKEPNKRSTPSPEKPKKDAFKAPITAKAKTKAPDPKGKILSAHFVTLGQQPLKDLQLNVPFYAKIRSEGMKGKTIKLTLFEDDSAFDDPVYEKFVLITSDVSLHQIKIDEEMYKVGGDLSGQQYYIEIKYTSETVNSSVLNLRDDAPLTKMKTGKSTVGVKKQEKKQENNKEECKSCQILLTVNDLDKFMKVTGHGSILNQTPYDKRIPAYISYLNKYMSDFEINKNCYRRANFLGQVAKETKFWSYKEDFVHSVGSLISNLKNFRTLEGKKYANELGYKKNKSEITKEIEIKIANYAYARNPKRFDLGNNECPLNKLNDPEEDGYKYRGRGLIQLTGRNNYTKFQEWYNKNRQKLSLPDVDFIKNPDLVFEPEYIVLSAIYFWDANNLNQKANSGVQEKDVLTITNIINSGEDQNKKNIRFDYVKAAYDMLTEKASDCPLKAKNQISKSNSSWHDPVDNPQITVHNFNGSYDPDFSSFGGHRGRPHTGLDIFAINKRTKIYACLKGKIVYSDNIPGYGKTIVLKVDKDDLEKNKKNYTLKYDREQTKGDAYDSGENRYILYAHLSSYEFTKKDVEPGDVIAISGVTGIAEATHGPHLHIEFSSKQLPQRGDHYKYRCNPLYYISLVTPDRSLQEKYNKVNRSTDNI
ncbi:hypothetical protein ABEG63_16030 [Chryseobacterium sp. C39-AII1]|uniref:hypothetical protein n=1 Tax=Chryseobacterium sp. C39-AII1 TaxID=3080332 RepID=UPI00320A9E01